MAFVDFHQTTEHHQSCQALTNTNKQTRSRQTTDKNMSMFLFSISNTGGVLIVIPTSQKTSSKDVFGQLGHFDFSHFWDSKDRSLGFLCFHSSGIDFSHYWDSKDCSLGFLLHSTSLDKPIFAD